MPFNKIAELGMEIGKAQIMIDQMQTELKRLQEENQSLNARTREQAGIIEKGRAENTRLLNQLKVVPKAAS